MIAGTLEIQLISDMSRLQQDMQKAKQMTGDSMATIGASMATVKTAIDAMATAENARGGIFTRTLDETKRLLNIASDAAAETTKSLAGLKIDPKALNVPAEATAALNSWRDQAAAAIGSSAAAGWDKVKTAWEDFKTWMERSLIVWGVALAVGISAAIVGAVYVAFKGINFAVGLLTGESYKSANIDALVAMNKEVKSLQDSLQLTAVGASALNEALKANGVTASAYAATINSVVKAQRTNTDELDRLGVNYKGSTRETLTSAAGVIASYAPGYDQHQAETAIGMGSEKQIQDALAVTAEKTDIAKERLIAYGLIIGEGTQEQVAKYEEAMRAFNREADLSSQGFKRAIADNIMPILADLATFFREGFPSVVMTFRYSMATIASLFYGLKTVFFMVTESILGSIQALGIGFGGLATAAFKAMSGDFSGAQNALAQGWADASARMGGIGDNIIAQAQNNRAAMMQAWGADSLGANSAADAVGGTGKTWVPKPSTPKPTTGKEVENPYFQLMAGFQKQLLATDKEASEVDKLVITLTNMRADAYAKLTTEQQINLYVAAHEIDLKKQAKVALEAWVRAENIAMAEQKEIDDFMASRQKKETDAILGTQKRLDQLQFETTLIGMSNEQKEVSIALRALETDGMNKESAEYLNLGVQFKAAIADKAAAEKQMADTKAETEGITKLWTTAAKEMQKSMSTFFFDIMQGKLSNIGTDFKKVIDKMVADQLAAQAASTLFGPAFAKGGDMGGLVGKGLDWLGIGKAPVEERSLVDALTGGSKAADATAFSSTVTLSSTTFAQQITTAGYVFANSVTGGAGLSGAGGALEAGGGLFGGLFGGGASEGGGALLTVLSEVAKGDVFSGGNVIRFGRGGVVNGPTLFPMASGTGLMGEAGPEAVMPLKRGSDGKLGVSTSGGARMNVTNVFHISGQTDQRSQEQISAAAGQGVQRALARHT